MGIRSNIPQVSAQIRQAAAHVEATAGPAVLKVVGIQLLAWAKVDYVSRSRGKADAAGNKWRPIKPETVDNRNRRLAAFKALKTRDSRRRFLQNARGKGFQIGVDRGLLLASLQLAGKGNVFEAAGLMLTFGTNIEYAEFYDAGRPILFENMVTPDRLKQIEALIFRSAETELARGLG